MRALVAVLALALAGVMLAEFFVAFLLPRRVKREPRLARRFIIVVWRPWRAVASRLAARSADTMLGIFGPLALIGMLAFWTAGLIVAFAGLYWANHSHLAGPDAGSFGTDLYYSAGTFFSASTALTPTATLTKAIEIAEAASGFAVLFIAIGYLPALFQAFSRRETAVSQLDPRAGSPPSAGALLLRSSQRGGWEHLDSYLHEWETWAAELMETQLSYPILGYFRSQHVNQSWLAALTTIVDTCAFAMAFAPEGPPEDAQLTFAIGRHALADLASSFRIPLDQEVPERLDRATLDELISRLEGGGFDLAETDQGERALTKLRGSYEPYVVALSARLALAAPAWLPGEDAVENWRRVGAHRRHDGHE